MQPIKLTRSELKCLSIIAKQKTTRISDIAKGLHELPPQISRVLSSLQQKDFIRSEKAGLSKTVSFSEAKHAALARRIFLEFAHMPLDKLLAGASLEVLSAVSYLKLKNRKEIHQSSLMSESSIAQALEKLGETGIVHKRNSTYLVSPRFRILEEFAREFAHHLNLKTAVKFASDAVLLWENNHEFIIETARMEAADGFRLTGISSFPKFGIQLIASKSYFFRSPFVRSLRMEDVILHSILVPDHPMLPVLLLWKKQERNINTEYLAMKSERYGSAQAIKDILSYFSTQGRERPADFPPWNEFLLRAREYGLL